MGYYINRDNKGNLLPSHRKADALIADGAHVVTVLVFQPDLVCVVENGPFDAAGYCYNKLEFEAFNDLRDHRRRTWLIVPNAAKLSGYS